MQACSCEMPTTVEVSQNGECFTPHYFLLFHCRANLSENLLLSAAWRVTFISRLPLSSHSSSRDALSLNPSVTLSSIYFVLSFPITSITTLVACFEPLSIRWSSVFSPLNAFPSMLYNFPFLSLTIKSKLELSRRGKG